MSEPQLMGEDELEAALRLVLRIRLTANDGSPMYTSIEAAHMVHEYTEKLVSRKVKEERDRFLAP